MPKLLHQHAFSGSTYLAINLQSIQVHPTGNCPAATVITLPGNAAGIQLIC
jgi:hypothetical protein